MLDLSSYKTQDWVRLLFATCVCHRAQHFPLSLSALRRCAGSAQRGGGGDGAARHVQRAGALRGRAAAGARVGRGRHGAPGSAARALGRGMLSPGRGVIGRGHSGSARPRSRKCAFLGVHPTRWYVGVQELRAYNRHGNYLINRQTSDLSSVMQLVDYVYCGGLGEGAAMAGLQKWQGSLPMVVFPTHWWCKVIHKFSKR